MPVAPLGTGLSLSLRGSVGLFLQTPYLDVPPAAALLRLCWISSFSWLPKQCWLFCFSPTYLGWRLSWLLLIPAFDGGSYRQYVPLQHPQPTYCGSCSTALLPVILGKLLWKFPCSNHCQSRTWSDPHLLLRTDCAVFITFITKSLLSRQRSDLLSRCLTASLLMTFHCYIQAQRLSQRSWSWVNTNSTQWAGKNFPVVQIKILLRIVVNSLYVKLRRKGCSIPFWFPSEKWVFHL